MIMNLVFEQQIDTIHHRFEIIDKCSQMTFQLRVFVFASKDHRRFEVQDLVNIRFYKTTTMILNVRFIQIL
jgi:hypothetical protein